MYRKAQAAMEFLMTYGWAILVVLVAIGALAYFGVLNPSRFLPNSCTITPGVSCDDFIITYDESVIADDNTIQLILRNGMGDSFNTVSVAVAGCLDDPLASGDAGDTWTDGAVLGGSGGITLTACPDTLVTANGARAKTDVTVTYTGSSGLEHTVTGSITGQAV